MKRLAIQLFRDEAGIVVTPEIIIITTVGLLSLIAGWNAVSNALASELGDVANSVAALDQSYSYRGISAGAHATCAGGGFADSNQTFTVETTEVTIAENPDGSVTIPLLSFQPEDDSPTEALESEDTEEEVAIFDVERLDSERTENIEAIETIQSQIDALQNLLDETESSIQSADNREDELKSLLQQIQKLCKRADELKAARRNK